MKPKFFISLPRLLSFHGRISRLQYFVYSLIYLAIFMAFVVGMAAVGLLRIGGDGYPTGTPLQFLIYSLAMLMIAYLGAANNAKRSHDIGWLAILGILPVIQIPLDLFVAALKAYAHVPKSLHDVQIIIDLVLKFATFGINVYLTFKAGDKGANKYGPDPLKVPAPVEVF